MFDRQLDITCLKKPKVDAKLFEQLVFVKTDFEVL